MNDSHTLTTNIRRIVLPLLVAVVLVVGTVIFSGSVLIRIEDVTINRILAGTYGEPDWRVHEMNPLLAQLLSLLYRIVPAVNWYGALLLLLLGLAAATGMSLAARKPGGLVPAIVVLAPIVVLLTNSMVSTAVCALCVVAGAFSLMDGLARPKAGMAQAIWGGVLFLFGAGLNLMLALLLAAGAALCWLPNAIRDSRLRGFLVGVPVLVVLLAGLFGYSALMSGASEIKYYQDNYARYERLQHSSLRRERDMLLGQYGEAIMSESHADHDHDGDGEPDGADHLHEDDVPANSFTDMGWTINDADMFFTRYGSDTELTSPDVLRALEAKASYWNFSPGYLFPELLETVKKPQFLLLIGLFVVSALGVLFTSRRKGLLVVLAALIAFGGHLLTLANYYDAFANIAPYYLLAIGILLYAFDGNDARAWLKRVFASPWLRVAVCALALVVFVAGLGGFAYYLRVTPVNVNLYTLDAVAFLKPYIAEHQDMLYIGDNPNERYKPDTLQAPGRGEDSTLLAGSYDLYSPRYQAMMDAFDITNPLPDSVGREDIGYVTMGFLETVNFRLASAYDIYVKENTDVFTQPLYAESIFTMTAFTPEEVAEMLGTGTPAEETEEAEETGAETPEASPEPSETPEQAAAPSATPSTTDAQADNPDA